MVCQVGYNHKNHREWKKSSYSILPSSPSKCNLRTVASIISYSHCVVHCAKGLNCLADTLYVFKRNGLNDHGHLSPCLALPLPTCLYEVYIWQWLKTRALCSLSVKQGGRETKHPHENMWERKCSASIHVQGWYANACYNVRVVPVGDQLDHDLVKQVLIPLRELARSRPWIKLMIFTGSKSQTARELEEGVSESPVSTIAGGTHYNSHALIT